MRACGSREEWVVKRTLSSVQIGARSASAVDKTGQSSLLVTLRVTMPPLDPGSRVAFGRPEIAGDVPSLPPRLRQGRRIRRRRRISRTAFGHECLKLPESGYSRRRRAPQRAPFRAPCRAFRKSSSSSSSLVPAAAIHASNCSPAFRKASRSACCLFRCAGT